ncbi:SpoIID/LytB domain-containing protein [Paenibacillus sp. NPDC058071]|uniref:SpoIID/LytB domain-containing protein n=1 Tax=Paenibacillus sp. NPDC058071 TaxID=3346326 RepID=UPI0036DA2851
MKFRSPLWRLTALTLIGLLTVSTLAVQPSQGAVPTWDTIRVAIFLQLPGKYTVNTPAATLSSSGGLTVGMREPSGTSEWLTAGGGAQLRFAKDDYKVKVAETASFDTALNVYKRLQSASGTGFITSLTKNGKRVYQVTEGTYAKASDASAALNKWNGDAQLTKLTGGAAGELVGPLHLEAGSYATASAAQQAANQIGAEGVDAFVAVRKLASSNAAVYSVMVGAAADAASLELIRVQAGASGAGLRPAADGSYLLLRNDHTLTGKADSPLTLYAFPSSSKVWVQPNAADPIKLTERFNRTYRGQFEMSDFNGKLAVVNELPFEHYLYSVVGGEMSASWPNEALKSQAVAARTYALYQGYGFQIANVVDSVNSQVYSGTSTEKPSTIQAVNETAGEVLLHKGKLIEALFSSSAGGMTADAKEIWGNAVPYLQAVKSPEDKASEKGLYRWFRVALSNGSSGYIREDLLSDTGRTNPAGLKLMRVTTDGTKVRKEPVIQDSTPLVATLNTGAEVAVLEIATQNNQMSWVKGPVTSDELLASMKGQTTQAVQGPIVSLEVSATGPSGRVTEMKVNGSTLPVKSPVNLRPALGGLQSTLFQVDETAKVSITGAGGASRTKKGSETLYVIGADGSSRPADSSMYVLNGSGKVRQTTKDPAYRFIGTGNGHGVGLSQYGALGLANQGYDYSYILQYYYKDVTIAKE